MAGRQAGEAGVEPVAAVSLRRHRGPRGGAASGGAGRVSRRRRPRSAGGHADPADAGPARAGVLGGGQGVSPNGAAPDPVDRWSRRVVGRLACDLGAKALFPFGGPPYHAVLSWALRTGSVWESPVRLLVHGTQGLMVSFRGALALKEVVDLPPPPARPCDTCARPCLTACPVGALTGAGYDVAALPRLPGSARRGRIA